MKKHKLGMYLGRFQPFHNGHKAIVDKMLEECEQVLIVVSSSDKKGIFRNPFPSWERAMMIKEVYPDERVDCFLLPDRATIANDCAWGDYVINTLQSYGYDPDAIYQGYESERCTWYDNWDVAIENISRLEIPVSATLVRAAIVEKRADYIDEWCPPEVAARIKKSIFWGRDFHDSIGY